MLQGAGAHKIRIGRAEIALIYAEIKQKRGVIMKYTTPQIVATVKAVSAIETGAGLNKPIQPQPDNGVGFSTPAGYDGDE